MIILASCKKHTIVEPEPIISLIGKWNVDSTTLKIYENSALVNAYTFPGNGATNDFQAEGILVLLHDGVIESHRYTILPDSKVEIEGTGTSFIHEIRNLTASSVALFLRRTSSPGNYDETLASLKR